MKKMLAVLLAVLFCFGIGAPVLAEEETTTKAAQIENSIAFEAVIVEELSNEVPAAAAQENEKMLQRFDEDPWKNYTRGFFYPFAWVAGSLLQGMFDKITSLSNMILLLPIFLLLPFTIIFAIIIALPVQILWLPIWLIIGYPISLAK